MKILLIRFSSFGDVLQTLSVAGRIGQTWPQAEIQWVTRAEFAPLIEGHPRIQKVWTLPKGAGFQELVALAWRLRKEKFTHVYDAHNNLRSHILGWLMWGGGHKFLRRSIYRWKRFLLFRFRINKFPKPFSGQFALLEPLAKWGLPVEAPAIPQLFLPVSSVAQKFLPDGFSRFVTLAPSAAFALKRWPLEYWKELIDVFPEQKFVVLGGPEDLFLRELARGREGRVINLAGKLSLTESAEIVAASEALVANDTGLMHVAEQTGKPCLALMGPAPFGYPSRLRTTIFERDLWCRPCSKHGQGPCVNKEFHKCMRDIRPPEVADGLRRVLGAPVDAPLPR